MNALDNLKQSVSKMSAAVSAAVPVLSQSINPADVQAAADSISSLADQLTQAATGTSASPTSPASPATGASAS